MKGTHNQPISGNPPFKKKKKRSLWLHPPPPGHRRGGSRGAEAQWGPGGSDEVHVKPKARKRRLPTQEKNVSGVATSLESWGRCQIWGEVLQLQTLLFGFGFDIKKEGALFFFFLWGGELPCLQTSPCEGCVGVVHLLQAAIYFSINFDTYLSKAVLPFMSPSNRVDEQAQKLAYFTKRQCKASAQKGSDVLAR